MPRDEARAEAQQLLLRALGANPTVGMTEGSLKRVTLLSTSLFHEAISELLEQKAVVISQGDGHRNVTQYHLVKIQVDGGVQEGPVSLLAATVLDRLRTRAEGTRALAKGLELDADLVQRALDELDVLGLVSRSQVGMLVIYRALFTSD